VKPKPVKSVHDVIGEVVVNGNRLVLGVLLKALADAESKGQRGRVRLIRARLRRVEDRIKKGSLHGT
jgi:hypothetical protein